MWSNLFRGHLQTYGKALDFQWTAEFLMVHSSLYIYNLFNKKGNLVLKIFFDYNFWIKHKIWFLKIGTKESTFRTSPDLNHTILVKNYQARHFTVLP